MGGAADRIFVSPRETKSFPAWFLSPGKRPWNDL